MHVEVPALPVAMKVTTMHWIKTGKEAPWGVPSELHHLLTSVFVSR